MHNQGLVIDTFQIQSVDDFSGYLDNLGRPEAALAEKRAKMAEAQSLQEAEQATAIAEEQVALAQQQLIIKRAELKEVADVRQARADAAGPLAAAQQNEQVIIHDQQVALRRAELREKELDTEVRMPVDAEKYRLIQLADAKLEERRRASEAAEIEATVELAKRKLTAEGDRVAAEADAASNMARGNADAAVIEAKGQAEGAVIKFLGQPEAESTEARGLAGAAGIAAQAEAYEKVNEAGRHPQQGPGGTARPGTSTRSGSWRPRPVATGHPPAATGSWAGKRPLSFPAHKRHLSFPAHRSELEGGRWLRLCGSG